jgi:O-antigen/teichoic acid export membrane protein
MVNELDKITEDSARGGFFLMSGSILSTVIMAIAAILVGRLLGPDLYGEYNLALVVPSLLLLFADLGMNSAVTKFAASLRVKGENSQITKIIRYALLIQTLVGLAVFTVNFALADLFAILINRPSTGFYIQIASMSILFQVIYNAGMAAFVGLDKTEYNALAANIQATAKTGTSITLVLLGFGVAGATVGYVAGYVVGGLVAAAILFFKILKPLDNGEKDGFMQTLKVLTNYGTPLYASILLGGFMPLYQQVVLAFFTSNSDFGNFRASTNFLALMSIIPASITTALLPAFSKLDSSKAEGLKVFFKRATKYSCLLILPIVTLLMIFSDKVVQVVYGSAFQPASFFLSVGCLSYFLVGIGYLTLASLFNGIGETGTTLKITLVNLLVFLLLAPILASKYGVSGAIVTSLVSNAAGMLYAVKTARAKFEIDFDAPSTAKIYMVAAASVIPSLLLLRFTSMSDLVALIAGGVMYLLIYITLIPLTRVMGYYELQGARQAIQRIRILALIARPLLKYEEKMLRLRMNMKVQISFKQSIILALLLAGIVINTLSLFFFTQIDHIVHADLYRYGLQFSYEWAGQYWMYSGFITGSFAIALLATALSIVSLIVNARTHGAGSRFVCYLLLLVGTVSSIFSALSFTHLDYLVNNDLYRYGLQFSYEWALPYWTFARLLLGLTGLAGVITVISFISIYLSARAVIRINQTKLTSSILVAAGATALILSINYASSVLAFVGLGLVFWGIIFIYIRPEEYSKRALLDATVSPLLTTLDQIMKETNYEGKAVFLPPRYFSDPEASKAYISKQKNAKLPAPEQIQQQETNLIIDNPQGVLLTPPGAELTKLFETTLETSFTRIDLQYLKQNMPKLFIEDLEIAQNFEIETENDKVRVKIENSAYQNLTKEAMNLPLYKDLGCPISSAIACALAKATGRPITIESQKASQDNKSIVIEYHIVKEEQTQQ